MSSYAGAIYGELIRVWQAITVKDTESGIQLVVRKKGAAPNAVRPAFATTTIRPRSGGRRAAGVTAKLAKRSYRPDLRVVSVLACSLPSLCLLYPVRLVLLSHSSPRNAPPRARWTAARHYESWVWT